MRLVLKWILPWKKYINFKLILRIHLLPISNTHNIFSVLSTTLFETGNTVWIIKKKIVNANQFNGILFHYYVGLQGLSWCTQGTCLSNNDLGWLEVQCFCWFMYLLPLDWIFVVHCLRDRVLCLNVQGIHDIPLIYLTWTILECQHCACMYMVH